MVRRNKVFEDLGLYDDPVPLNPYDDLGLNRKFAGDLLHSDPSGDALRLVASGLYRTLSRVYHPNAGSLANTDRFRGINDASVRIAAADTTALRRWSTADAAAARASKDADKANERLAAISEQGGKVVDALISTQGHPLHFGKFNSAHGLLVSRDRGSKTYLLEPTTNGAVLTTGSPRRVTTSLGSDVLAEPRDSTLAGLRDFLQRNDYFGSTPDEGHLLLVKDTGEAAVYSDSTEWIADGTEALEKYVGWFKGLAKPQMRAYALHTAWARHSDEVQLFGLPAHDPAETKPEFTHTVFSKKTYGNRKQPDYSWNIPTGVIGTLGDTQHMRRRMSRASVDYSRPVLEGSQRPVSQQFAMLALSADALLAPETAYSPLLSRGNTLLLQDTDHHLPVATDLTVTTLLSSGK